MTERLPLQLSRRSQIRGPPHPPSGSSPAIIGTRLQKLFKAGASDDDLLCHGVWTQGFQPPDLIKPFETVEWRSESDGWLRGTEGYVVYELPSDDTVAELHGYLCITWVNAFLSYDSRGGTRYSVNLVFPSGNFVGGAPTLDGCTDTTPNPSIYSPTSGMGGYTFSEASLGNADLYGSGGYEATTVPNGGEWLFGTITLAGMSTIYEHALLSLTLVNCSESCQTQFASKAQLSAGIRSLQPDGHPNISLRSIMRLRNLS